MKYGIFIFRRDMRIVDNQGLIKLNELVDVIVPIFIFDQNQAKETTKNKYHFSNNALRFICECVENVDSYLDNKLNIFYGDYKKIILNIIKHFKNEEIIFGFNEDFSLYSIKRDDDIKKILDEHKIEYATCDYDWTLAPMEYLIKTDGQPYKQYGAFRKNVISKKKYFTEVNNKKIKFTDKKLKITKLLSIEKMHKLYKTDKNYKPIEIGSREVALKILKNLDKFDEYNTDRDLLTYNTLRISAHLNFGVISEREFYDEVVKHLGNKSLLINQVIWRDYYLCLLRYLEGANSYENHIDDRYNKLKWLDYYSKPFKNNTHKRSYEEWKIMMESKTGFLLVDACLNEIKTTGYMHNRGRLIVGYFSTKYLLINPLAPYVGLQSWFSRHLVDCLTSQNKLNCQFLTELDFSGKKFSKKVIDGRPMNISNLMIKKYDPSCEYIKKWLPHLKDVDNKTLYKWDVDYDDKLHPGPMFDAKSRYQEWIKLCT